MPWENWLADGSPRTATWRKAGVPLALALLLGTADAQGPYVREVHDMTGLSVTVRQVRCRADGQPETWADVSLVRQGGLYRIGRVAYNDGARAVLDQGQAFPVTRRAYERYVLGGEPFNELGMNALLGLWRALGMRFRLDGAEFRCRVN